MKAPFDIFQSRQSELEALDNPSFHSEREFEIYREKSDLGLRTRLGNLFAKKVILEKLGLDLQGHASHITVDRLSAQGYGFGMPVVRLRADLETLWKEKFKNLPHVSLSHEGDRFALALTGQSESSHIGVDVMSVESIHEIYRSGALAIYISAEESKTLDILSESTYKKDYVLALWCLKEAVFKAIASENLLGANNRFKYIQATPDRKDGSIEGAWKIEILSGDEPLQFKGRWYPRLLEIFHDLKLNPKSITATFQKLDDRFGLAVVNVSYV